MHYSAHAVAGLLGLASISTGLPTGNTAASALPAGEIINATATINTTQMINTTQIINITENIDVTSASPLPEIINVTDITNYTEDVNTSVTNLPQVINGTTTDPVFSDNTQGFLWLSEPPKDRRLTQTERRSLYKRGDLPPRDRTLADHMENYGQKLPECYKKCMRSEDGKASMHMGQDTLGTICGIKWPMFAWWSEHHIYWCVNGKGGCNGKQPHREAYKWLKWTCGDKPN